MAHEEKTAPERPDDVYTMLQLGVGVSLTAEQVKKLFTHWEHLEAKLSEAEKVIDEIDVTYDITDIWKLTAAYRSQSQEGK